MPSEPAQERCRPYASQRAVRRRVGRGRLRLLPCTSPEEKLCYLSSDGRGYLSTLAYSIETVQLCMDQALLEYARDAKAPGAEALSASEHCWWACRLAEALADALRVADSCGQRILDQEEAAEDA